MAHRSDDGFSDEDLAAWPGLPDPMDASDICDSYAYLTSTLRDEQG